jgi:hypothetical protein
MEPVTLGLLGIVGLGVAGSVALSARSKKRRTEQQLADAMADARRWTERLGGQVLNLSANGNPAAAQALADAGERYNAAGSQLEQARTPTQATLARQTALEGLYYVRAARSALGLDPGPDLPHTAGQDAAGAVSENREVSVGDHRYAAGPQPTDRTTHYYPGGVVAGRPVPRGWYSEPFWKTALVGGAWGVGSALLFTSLFGGMSGIGWGGGFDQGYGEGYSDGLDAQDHDNFAGDADSGDYADSGGYDGGYNDGGDFGGSDFGDFGGGDFGGGDFGGDF